MSQEELNELTELFRTLASWRDELTIHETTAEEKPKESGTGLH